MSSPLLDTPVQRLPRGFALLLALAVFALCPPALAQAAPPSFLGGLTTITPVGSTVPANGDENPYGIANVPTSVGSLVRGDTLISNFNDKENEQGTGTTLVELSPSGAQTPFAQINPATLPGPCPGGVGLTTALSILPGGFVVVGSLPTGDGTAATAKAGCLIVLDSSGHVVRTIAGPPINGPWDMTAVSAGPFSALFVTNVLNGTVEHGETPTDGGTVVRIGLFALPGHTPVVFSEQVIANGFPERTDEAALVIGPTGVALGHNGMLYVADTLGNRIAAIPGALDRGHPFNGGLTVTAGGSLKGPLGLALAPNGDILTANAGDGHIIETTPFGMQFPPLETGAGEGGLFGLTPQPGAHGLYFVNDAQNELDLAH